MKGKEAILAVVLCIALPFMLGQLLSPDEKPETGESISAETEAQTQETTEETQVLKERQVTLLKQDGSVETLPLESYLAGVILGELPGDFQLETMKALAVAARTLAIKGSENPVKHPQAAVCWDSGCCQAYCAPDTYLEQGGSQEVVDKVRQAVKETQGQVLLYQGELIEATYFSCSGGRTEDAVAVWGTDIPYLQAQDSPGEEDAEVYMDTVTFPVEDFTYLLGIEPSATGLQVDSVTYTRGGGVDTIVISGKEFDGGQMRQLLGLRSTAFAMQIVGETVTITTKGFGHRVGLSQYGAEAMAQSGSNYLEILGYYYPNTEIHAW